MKIDLQLQGTVLLREPILQKYDELLQPICFSIWFVWSSEQQAALSNYMFLFLDCSVFSESISIKLSYILKSILASILAAF